MELIIESTVFGIIMTIFGFLVSYITDLIIRRKIIFFPKHAPSIASGTFITSFIVFILFSKKYLEYKKNNE